jgi:hypothetical protein
MANQPNARQFLISNEAVLIRQELETMMINKGFNTRSTYSPSEPTSESFVDKHMKYLSLHTNTNPRQYVLNLKLRTRITK